MPHDLRKWILTVGLSVLAVASGLLCVRQARQCAVAEARLERLTRQESALRQELHRAEAEATGAMRWAALEPRMRAVGLDRALVSPLEISRVSALRELDDLLPALLADCQGGRGGLGCWFRPESFRLERTSGQPGQSGQSGATPAVSPASASAEAFHVSVRGRMIYLQPKASPDIPPEARP